MDKTVNEEQKMHLIDVINGLDAFALDTSNFVEKLKKDLLELRRLTCQINELNQLMGEVLSRNGHLDENVSVEITHLRNRMQSTIRKDVTSIKQLFKKIDESYKQLDPTSWHWQASHNLERPISQFMHHTHDILQSYRLFMITLEVCQLPHNYTIPTLDECNKSLKFYDRVLSLAGKTEIVLNQKCLKDLLQNVH